MFPPTYISCDYCCYLRVPFDRLAPLPGIYRSHTSRRGTLCIHSGVFNTYYMCFAVVTSNTSRIYTYTQKALWFTHVSFRTKLFAWACGRVAREHPHTHLPTSHLAWSSRTKSHLEANPSAAINSGSVVASSAAHSSSGEADGSAASSAPGSNQVDEGEPPEAVLQPPNTAETTVSANNKSFSVTIQPPMAGPKEVDCLGLAVCE